MARKPTRPTVDNGLGLNARDNWSGERATPHQQQQLMGFYIAQVMDDQDDQRMGRLWVYIQGVSTVRFDETTVPSYGGTTPDRQSDGGLAFDQNLRNGWLLVSMMSPFFGSDDFRNPARPDGTNSTTGDVNSYGMWSQPRIGDWVGVMFDRGDPNSGYWVGMVPKQQRNGMVPGNPGTTASSIDSNRDQTGLAATIYPGAQLPTMDRVSEGSTATDAGQIPISDLARAQVSAGVSSDSARGAGTSGARRESPSYVTGIKSGGWSYDSEKYNKDTNGVQFEQRIADVYHVNSVGHSFVMDDHPDHQLMRLRTSNGAQILMYDAGGTPFIYIQTATGAAWVELADSGDISIYSKGGIHVHSGGDLNLSVDGDMNVDIKGNYNVRAGGDYSLGIAGFSQQSHQGSMIIGVNGSLDSIISGPARLTYDLDLDVRVGQKLTETINYGIETFANGTIQTISGGDLEMNAQGGVRMGASDGFSINVGGSLDLATGGNLHMSSGTGINILSSAALHVEATSVVSLKGGSDINIDGGPNINLNSGLSVHAEVAAPAVISIITYAADAAAVVLPKLHITQSVPSDAAIRGTEVPDFQESGAPVVPQHQPWTGRTGTGTGGTTGLVTPQPISGAPLPGGANLGCNQTNLAANIRNGAGTPNATSALSVVGGISSLLGNFPGFFSGASFAGLALGEAPVYKAVRLASIIETHVPSNLAPSTSVLNFIKSVTSFSPTPQLNANRSAYVVGYDQSVQTGITIGGVTIDAGILGKIGSFASDIEKMFTISITEAESAFMSSIDLVTNWIEGIFPDIEFTQSQYDAIVSFTHHVGIAGIEGTPEGQSFIGAIQQGNMEVAQSAMYQFSHVGGGVDCSVLDRRRTEAAAFGQMPDRDGVVKQNIQYTPDGQLVTIAGFHISSTVFNAICNAQKNIAPQLPDGYLMTICSMESGFNPNAMAGTSNAAGLFQFITTTGARYGLSTSRTPDSNVFDPVANADAGAQFAVDNYNILVGAGLPPPNGTDMYMAHFLGAGGATTFLGQLHSNPNDIPALNPSFSAPASANRPIFYNNSNTGSPKTYQEVYDNFDRTINKRLPYFSGACGSQGPLPPQTGTLPDTGSGITWVPGSRTPDFTNVGAIRGIVETAATQAGLTQLVFNSGYRDPQLNAAVDGAQNSQHLYGRAIDISIGNMTLAQRRAFVDRLASGGVTGMGVGGNLLHVDNRPSSRVTWTYVGGNAWCVDILQSYGFRGA